MLKFTFFKKNKILNASEFNAHSLSPVLVWTRILYISIAVVLLSVILSAMFMWKILREELSGSGDAVVNTNTSINKEKLKEVVEIMTSRDN